jgi:hypothetical protein
MLSQFCPFGFIFCSEDTERCALSLYAIADGSPRKQFGLLQLVLGGLPMPRRRNWSADTTQWKCTQTTLL